MDETMLLALDGSEVVNVPNEIKILPLGHVTSAKGDFDVDNESFTLIQQQFKDRKIDLVIDYEHQTLDNIQAPAGGWIKELYKTEDAIVAKVEWTEKAKEYLKNKEYRYLSPVVLVRKSKAIALHSAALTNTPAIDGMFAIVNSCNIDKRLDLKQHEGGIQKMELEKLIKLLGLEGSVTEDDVLNALTKVIKASEEKTEATEGKTELVANSVVLSLLDLPSDAKTDDVTAKIMVLKAGDTNTAATVLALKADLENRKAEECVQLALKSGKIAAAQKDWATAYALKDPTGFGSFLEKAPTVVPMNSMGSVEAPKSEQVVDTLVLKNLGLTAEDVKKYGNREE